MKFKITPGMRRTFLSWLKEDSFNNDITTNSPGFPRSETEKAVIKVKEDGILCGIDIILELFLTASRARKIRPPVFKTFFKDGSHLKKGTAVMEITGRTDLLLSTERTALNILSRLSGIATAAGKFCGAAKKTETVILDTRKTLPGYRDMEKYAVRTGGMTNHRRDLSDSYLFKDNHRTILKNTRKDISNILEKLSGKKEIIVEVRDMEELKEILNSTATVIMLDNMTIPQLKKAISLIRKSGKKKIELSGNISLENIGKYLALKPDRISAGSVTHSAPALDFSMKILEVK